MKNKLIRDVTLIALFAAVISVASFISIPTSAAPITLQTFGILSTLYLLGGRRGTIAVAVYVALGTVGLPVFSGFTGGIGRLLDSTGGFVWGFLALALLYWLLSHLLGSSFRATVISSFAAHLVLYAVGAGWFYLGYAGRESFLSVLALTVLPYLLPDALKMFLAIFVCEKIKKRLNKPL